MFALERWQPGAADPPFLNVGTGPDPPGSRPDQHGGRVSSAAQPTAHAALNGALASSCATPATRALLWVPPGVSGLLCDLYGTEQQAMDGLGLPLPQCVATGTGSGAAARAAPWGLPIPLPDRTSSLVRFRRTSSGELKLSAR